jgi:Pyridoxamine 5'-phosphate oxidase
MAKVVDEINTELARWIREQPMFFVATAPSGRDGHVNLSPKGLAALAILGPHRVAYLDLTGSGVETIAHLRENGRITIMLCAFAGPPRICRLYGRGTVHTLGSDEFETLVPEFPTLPGARAVIDVAVTRISTSCGYSVPLMDLVGARDNLNRWASGKGEDALVEYRDERNAESIDGLAGYPAARLADHS